MARGRRRWCANFLASVSCEVRRRAKYLLIELERGTLIAHLGMSGSLRVLKAGAPLLAHDHYDLRARLRPLPALQRSRAASAACSG